MQPTEGVKWCFDIPERKCSVRGKKKYWLILDFNMTMKNSGHNRANKYKAKFCLAS